MLREAVETGPIWALGTMSGTSLDGIDAAMIRTDGAEIFEFGRSAYRPYGEDERDVLRAALGRWTGHAEAAAVIDAAHLELLTGMPEAAVVGFHGQTTAHDPAARRTCQIGDGRKLAHALGCPVVWDFRSADVAEGGQGAPLVPFYHHAVMRRLGGARPVAILNLGGVGNLTWVDPRIPDPAGPGACLAFDTGPANAPLNDLMRTRFAAERDDCGALGAAGTADRTVIDHLLAQEYFRTAPPKSLDRDAFAWLQGVVADLGDADAAATLTRAVAETVAAGLTHCPSPPAELLVTGGGRHNATMMRMLSDAARLPVRAVETVGLDGDMLEAQAFAYLAVRVVRGWPITAPGTTGAKGPLTGGKLADPRRPETRAASGSKG